MLNTRYINYLDPESADFDSTRLTSSEQLQLNMIALLKKVGLSTEEANQFVDSCYGLVYNNMEQLIDDAEYRRQASEARCWT